MRFLIVSIFFFITKLHADENKFNDLVYYHNYCTGYLEEVYWTLDPILDKDIRKNIDTFFIKKFPESEDHSFTFFYDKKDQQLKLERDKKGYRILTEYPVFEVLLLHGYMGLLFDNPYNNYCPAFGDDDVCTEESIDVYLESTIDFSNEWLGEEEVITFLYNDFQKNPCFDQLSTDIDQVDFLYNLNQLINLLTTQ